MSDKFASTPLLLNGQAACYMGQGRFDDAESCLQEALDKVGCSPQIVYTILIVQIALLHSKATMSHR